jgi:hypothetical protein
LVLRRGALKELGRLRGINGCRELETDNGGNHRQFLHALARVLERSENLAIPAWFEPAPSPRIQKEIDAKSQS